MQRNHGKIVTISINVIFYSPLICFYRYCWDTLVFAILALSAAKLQSISLVCEQMTRPVSRLNALLMLTVKVKVKVVHEYVLKSHKTILMFVVGCRIIHHPANNKILAR